MISSSFRRRIDATFAASALRHRGFAAFFAASSISNAASWMQNVTVAALLYDLTESATWLGLVTLAWLVPAAPITPFAGVLSDRFDRRKILLATQTLQMSVAFGLLALYAADAITPRLLLVNSLLTGLATGFQTSTWQAYVPSLVPQADLMDAVRLNSLQFTMARLLGPAAATIVVSRWGAGAAIGANAVTYLLVMAALVAFNPQRQQHLAVDQHPLAALRDGARYVNARAPLRIAAILGLMTSFLGQPIQHISAAISAEVFHRASNDNAVMFTVLGIGSVVAGVFGNRTQRWLGRDGQMVFAMSMYCASIMLVLVSDVFWVGLVGYFCSGMAHISAAMVLNQVVQSESSEEYRGRAMSFYVLGILSGIPLGAFVFGAVADFVGIRAALAVDLAALLGLMGWAYAGRRLRALRPSTVVVAS